MGVRNENIIKQLTTRIINKLSGVKPLIKVEEFNDINPLYQESFISISIDTMEHGLDSYGLVLYLLDQIILDLTCKVKTKNYYCIKESVEDDIWEVVEKLKDVKWYASYQTHLEYLEMIDADSKMDDWTKLKINGKKINTLESTFPRSVIFGTEYPLLINPKKLICDDNIIKIPYHYVDDFHAIRLITDDRKRLIFLRKRKISKLRIKNR